MVCVEIKKITLILSEHEREKRPQIFWFGKKF